MHAELPLLADLRQHERTSRPAPQRAIAPRQALRTDFRATPAPAKDRTMTTWHIDTDIQLSLAQMKRDEQIRNSLLRQQLRDSRAHVSVIASLRLTVANALIALGQAVKPATRADEWTSATRTAA